jgi:hypothetical protein
MVCFVKRATRVDRIIRSIFHLFNLDWRTRTLEIFKQAAPYEMVALTNKGQRYLM